MSRSTVITQLESPTEVKPSLTWRIGDAGGNTSSKRWTGILLSTALMAAFLLLLAPAAFRIPAMIGLTALTTFRVWFTWRLDRVERSWRIGEGDNCRLDVAGFHWKMADDEWRKLARERVRGFRFAPDALTLNPVTALTLLLEDNWESQPIELHAPATIEAARKYLTEAWAVEETILPPERLAKTLIEALGAACHAPPLNSAKRVLWRSLFPHEELALSLASESPWRKIAVIDGWSETISWASASSCFLIEPNEAAPAADEVFECADVGELLKALERLGQRLGLRARPVLAHRLQSALADLSDDALTLAGTNRRDELIEFLSTSLAADCALPIASLTVRCSVASRDSFTVEGRLADTAGGLRFWGTANVARGASSMSGEIDASREKDEIDAAVRLLGAAERLGFLSEIIAGKSEWRLTGGKARLLALCDHLEAAAKRIEPPPLAARPCLVELGDPEMPLTLAFGEGAAIDGEILWIDPATLRDLAGRMRAAIAAAEAGETIVLAPSLGSSDRWRFIIGVRQNNSSLSAEDLYREETPGDNSARSL